MAVQPKQNDDIGLYEYQLPAVSAKEQHHNEHIYDCYQEKPLPPQSITREKKLLILLVILQIILLLLIFLMLGLIVKLFLADLQPSANSPVISCDENISNFNAVNDLQVLMKIGKKTTSEIAENVNMSIIALESIQDTTINTSSVIKELLLLVKDMINNGVMLASLPKSCKEVKLQKPSSVSGVYELATGTCGETWYAYCHMEELCGSGGGWTRLAYLNMSDSAQNCPPEFKLYQSGGVRACGRLASDNAGCVSNKFPSNGIAYSEVCGRVVGYQYGTPDAVSNENSPQNHNTPGADYVDGVSITYGSSYNHIWTLMAGWTDTQTDNSNTCPCSDYLPSNTNQNLQSFIGNNYFCESGNSNAHAQLNTLFTSDPLWDGKGCGPNEDRCCSAPGLPWFYRDFGNNTYITDYIELRVCGDESTQNEDVPVSYYEIYVK